MIGAGVLGGLRCDDTLVVASTQSSSFLSSNKWFTAVAQPVSRLALHNCRARESRHLGLSFWFRRAPVQLDCVIDVSVFLVSRGVACFLRRASSEKSKKEVFL